MRVAVRHGVHRPFLRYTDDERPQVDVCVTREVSSEARDLFTTCAAFSRTRESGMPLMGPRPKQRAQE